MPARMRAPALPEYGLTLGQTTGLLLERLQAWKHACGYLENYISATEKLEKSHAKEYDKVTKVRQRSRPMQHVIDRRRPSPSP